MTDVVKVCRPLGTSRGEHRANDTSSTSPITAQGGTTRSIDRDRSDTT